VKRFLISVVFACVLSSSALAGDIPSGGSPSPVPGGTTQTISARLTTHHRRRGREISDAAVSALLTVLGFRLCKGQLVSTAWEPLGLPVRFGSYRVSTFR
jgi:hypothetical protein